MQDVAAGVKSRWEREMVLSRDETQLSCSFLRTSCLKGPERASNPSHSFQKREGVGMGETDRETEREVGRERERGGKKEAYLKSHGTLRL